MVYRYDQNKIDAGHFGYQDLDDYNHSILCLIRDLGSACIAVDLLRIQLQWRVDIYLYIRVNF